MIPDIGKSTQPPTGAERRSSDSSSIPTPGTWSTTAVFFLVRDTR